MSEYDYDAAAKVAKLFLDAGYPEHHDAVTMSVTRSGNEAYAEGYSEGQRVVANGYDYLPSYDVDIEYEALHAAVVSDSEASLPLEEQQEVKTFLSSRWKEGRVDGEHDTKDSSH